MSISKGERGASAPCPSPARQEAVAPRSPGGSQAMPPHLPVMIGLLIGTTGAVDGEPPKVVRHVVVSKEDGRFAGWPANHGIWSWGDEILVGFSRGTYKDRGRFHHIDHDQPEEFLLARSRDGGMTWAVEPPRPTGALDGTRGMR